MTTSPAEAFIGIRAVCEISGFSRATIARKVRLGEFPRPVIAEKNTVRWDKTEVMQWRAAQFEKRNARIERPVDAPPIIAA